MEITNFTRHNGKHMTSNEARLMHRSGSTVKRILPRLKVGTKPDAEYLARAE